MRIFADVRLLGRGEPSGIQEYTQNLLRAMMANDHDNDYTLFYNGFRKQLLPHQLINSSTHNSLIDWHIPNKLLDFSTRFLGFPVIDDFIKADVVFSPHFNILKTKKTPRVITFHDLSFLHHPEFFSLKQKFWHWLQDYRAQARQAAKIIAVSEFTKSDLVNLLGVPEEKIEVIYSGISEEFKPMRNNNANDAKINYPYILYLGTLEPRKNVGAIIRAFNILKKDRKYNDFKLILAGRPGWLYRNILREAKQSPYAEDIVFWGKVKAEDRVLLYNLAKAFIYPSFFEGFGFPPLEAQACGCPVIVADRTSLSEVVGDSAVLIDPWRVDSLADALKRVLLNNSLREKLIQAGLENAKKYQWRTAAQKTLEVLTYVQ